MFKCAQAKKSEVLTTPEMLEDCKKKPRQQAKKKKEKLSKECHKNLG